MTEHQRSIEAVRQYYGEVLKSSADLRTSACCVGAAPAPAIARALDAVHEEIKNRFYGCGSPIPPALEGASVLDLGCGSGRDCYILSQLVGKQGRVIGVDMTAAQLDIARKHKQYHAEKFGFANVEFRCGYIEDLRALDIDDDSIDLVVSNCVLNLSPDKPRVFAEIFRVLKPGGELYFSDVFTDRRVPPALWSDPVLLGECLAGALYHEDFRRIMMSAGCNDFRTVSTAPLEINNPAIAAKLGLISFHSATIRAFKLALEDRCEDFGQSAIYNGRMGDHPHAFDLDDHHRFETGKSLAVCGNTADMLAQSRYALFFDVIGDKTKHFGLFDCGPSPVSNPSEGGGPSCC
jgi:ubiquinone/menaquinone biosynthesis C-methylase UbiE